MPEGFYRPDERKLLAYHSLKSMFVVHGVHLFCTIFLMILLCILQIQAQSTISNFGVAGLTAGLQTSFPGGADGKAHVCECFCYTLLHLSSDIDEFVKSGF